MNQVTIIIQMFQALPDALKKVCLDCLMGNSTLDSKKFTDLIELILSHNHTAMGDRPHCAHCHSEHVIKNGHKGETQRYLCKDCGRTFVITNNTILFSTKKKLDTWEKFLECVMNKFPLRRCADVCKINLKTAFIWRHKILDALQNMHNEVVINGVAEADETYFRVSYKGNHKKSTFQMPRKSRKRGGESSKRGISSEQACVLCSVNLDGLSIGMLSNLGRPFVMDLEAVFSQRIERGSILVTDSFRGYSKLAYENGLTHIAIPRGKHTNGAFNIQTVNAYHKDMKKLIQFQFSGVSTKYLNNYVVYHNFVNFAKGSFSEKLDILKDFVFTTRLTDRYQTIQTREPVPVLRAA